MSDQPRLSPASAGATLTIDLAALVANWREVDAMTGRAHTAAVVKADAYGLGIEVAGPALRSAGCVTFFVAHPDEGRRLRAHVPDAVIYVLNGLFPGALDFYAAHTLRPVLGSVAEIDRFESHCQAIGQRLPAALHVDTGMNRLGLDLAEAALVAEPGMDSYGFEPCLIMSHFACADEPGHALTARQIRLFEQVRGLFPGVPGSLANSAGCTLPHTHHDLVRPGIALYGGEFVAGRPPLRSVVRLQAPIIQIRELRAGETVGYGATWTADHACRIAIVSVGYADGYGRAAGGTDARPGGAGLVNGVKCPIAGRVSMDLIALDVTAAGAVGPGTAVTLIGDGLTVDDVARPMGTIGYEVLTNLGRRYARTCVGP